MTTLLWIPRKAWPALTQFAPDRFPELQQQFDRPDLSAELKAQVRAELTSLVREFQAQATAHLRVRRALELLTMGGREHIRQLQQANLLPRLCDLENEDLTFTERARLITQRDRVQLAPPIKTIEDALKALEKPHKYRDYKPTE